MDKKISCEVCQREFSNITTHLIKKHGINAKEYQLKYPDAKLVSEAFREKQSKRMRRQYERDDINYRAVAGSRTFDFINNDRLKILLQRDYKSAKNCLVNQLWKPAIILYGSLIEAILRENTKTRDFSNAIEKSYANKFISEIEYHKIHIVKDLRNLIHIHKELSEGVEINEYWARTFSDICEAIINRLKNKLI